MSDIYTDPPQSRNEAIIKSTIDGTQYTDPPQSRMEDLLLELKEVIEGGGGGGTTVVANPEGEATDELEKIQVGSDIYGISKDYEEMSNKPSINSVELSGNKTASELGLQPTLDGAQTVSGNPITVTDAEPINAESVVVELEPKQDLHGYDAPWVGGAGKNKCHAYTSTETQHDVTIAGNSEGEISVTGTLDGTNLYGFNLNTSISLGAGTYIMNGANPNGARLVLYDNHDNALADSKDAISSFTLESTTITILRLFVYANVQYNEVLHPMIRLATETDPTFAPYSNICPISGYSEVNVERVGKNWLTLTVDGIKSANTDGTWSGNTYSINNGSLTIQSDSAGNVTGITANGTFNAQTLFYCKMNALSVERNVIYNGVSDGSADSYSINLLIGERFAGDVYDGDSNIHTIPPNTDTLYIIVLRNGYNAQGVNFYPMIRLATETDPTFAPYQDNTYTIDLDGTKYGGTLDVTEGGYSDEWGTHTLDYVSLEDGLFTASAPNNVKGDVFAQAKCNRMKTWASVDDLDDNYGIAYSSNTFYMKLPPECGTTASEVDDWLGENPVSVVYLKKTPSSVSTTPTDMPLLENTNNISTDGTNIQLKYQPNNVIGECKAYTDEKCAKVLPPLPTTDGTYHLSCEVTSGVGVLSWVSDS